MIVAIAIVGGLALIGSLSMTVLCSSAAIDAAAEDSEEGGKMFWIAAISVLAFLMTIALFVLALVK